MSVIYKPRGRAREYADLALNLYNGCSHGCLYCYSPSVMRRNRVDFAENVTPRKDVLDKLRREAPKYSGDPRRILLCFTTDPYQPLEGEFENEITRRALRILGEAGCKVSVLTKGAKLARRDFDLMAQYDVHFGVTMVFSSELDREHWEPDASTIGEREEALKEAHGLGIRTWISIEPVIYPRRALEVIRRNSFVDRFKVGKLNHMPEVEATVNWTVFLDDLMPVLKSTGREWYIKNDLWKFASADVKAQYNKESYA
jgi:DNA repair photolyase